MIVLVSATTLMSLYLQVTKQVVKFMATEKLEKTQLIKVRVEKNKIDWVEEAHELRINGQLFDVKSYTVLSNGDIICKGIYDSAEDAIAASTGKLFDQKNNKTTKLLISKITSLVFEKEQPIKYLEAVVDANNIRYPLLPTPLAYLTKKITTPPPKCS
jgi:ribosomal protein L24E